MGQNQSPAHHALVIFAILDLRRPGGGTLEDKTRLPGFRV